MVIGARLLSRLTDRPPASMPAWAQVSGLEVCYLWDVGRRRARRYTFEFSSTVADWRQIEATSLYRFYIVYVLGV